ncbi:Gx transporter family protein [bacterium]
MDTKKIIKLALYISLAVCLQLAETMLLPPVIPGLKIGFANVITIIVLYIYSYKEAVTLAVLRTLVSSLMLGTFLAPAFILSSSGALGSAVIMSIFVYASFTRQKFSIVGVSVIGSLTHTIIQFSIAYYVFVKHSLFLTFLPFLLISSVITGMIIGYTAKKIILSMGGQCAES